jgi:hypothetical protein
VQLTSERSVRFFIYGPLAALLLLALSWSAYWFIAAENIRTELERLDGGEIIPGATLQFAAMNVGGFPFRFDIVLGGVTLAAQGQAGAWAWRSERISLHAAAHKRAPYILEADGLQTLSWPGEQGAPQNVLQMTSGIARAGVHFENGRLQRFDIDILNAEANDASLDAAPMRSFGFARAQARFMAWEDDTIGFIGSLDAGRIGSGYRPALGSDLSRVRIEGEISQAQNLQDLRAGSAGVRSSLASWRDAGGTIALQPTEAAWGGTLLQGDGELFLDENHRLAGRLSARPEDPVSFLGALAQSEMLPVQTRTQLGNFRDMISGMPGNLDLPIRLEAHLPLGPGPTTPRLRVQGINEIVVEFGSEAP